MLATTRYVAAFMGFVSVAAAAACHDSPAVKAQNKRAGQAVMEAGRALDASRRGYLKEANANLEALSQSLETLTAEAQKAQKAADKHLQAQLREAAQDRAAARQQLADLATAGDQAWEQARQGTDHAIDALRRAYTAAAAELRK